MPRLPSFLAQQPLPASLGMPRGVQEIPVGAQPTARDQGPTALEQSLGAFPQSLAALTQTMGQMAALEQHQRQAQDVLDTTLKEQDWQQRYDAIMTELEQGDYRTLPTAAMDEGKRLLATVIQEGTLTPQARAMLTARVQERLTLAQQRAFKVQGARRDEEATLAMSNAIHEVQQRVATATDPYERQVALGQFDEFAQQGVARGLFQAGPVAEARAKMLRNIAVQDLENRVQADPETAATQLRLQARMASGVATQDEEAQRDPRFPVAPADQLARLSQLATEVSWGRVQRGWAVERDAERRFEESQQAVEANLIARLSVLEPTRQNVKALDSLLAEVNRDAQGEHPAIRHAAQMPLVHAIQSLKAAALKPREVDDAGTARKLTLQIDAADNAQQLEQARLAVFQAAPMLKRSTVTTMLTSIRERKDAAHYSNIKGYRDGMALLLGADTNEAAYFAWMRQAADAETEQRQRHAIDLFRATMQRLAHESPAQANAEGTRIAQEIRDTYILKPQRATGLTSLVQMAPTLAGPDGQGLLDPEQARQAIGALPYMADEERQRLFDQWQTWATEEQKVRQPPPAPAPAPSFWQRWSPFSHRPSPTTSTPAPTPPAGQQPQSGTRPLRRVPAQ